MSISSAGIRAEPVSGSRSYWSAAVLHLIDSAPDGGLFENALVHAVHVVKSDGVQHDHAVQAVTVLIAQVRVVQRCAHKPDDPAQHSEQADECQQQCRRAHNLPCQTAVIADMFFSVICHCGCVAPFGGFVETCLPLRGRWPAGPGEGPSGSRRAPGAMTSIVPYT